MSSRIRPRVRDAILQALQAGVVPRTGIQHIQVARENEIREMRKDIDRIADGGSGIRFVIGDYGSGKTFFLNLVREMALSRKLVTVHCDLSSAHRLYSSGGQARAMYSELMRNMSTRSSPGGGALPAVVERFVAGALTEATSTSSDVNSVIAGRVASLSELVGGYDFGAVVMAYWRGHDTGDDELKSNAIRWLRGEFSTKTEARQALGVRTIVDDNSFYDHLKLVARFCRLAGFDGLLVCLDEMVSIYMLQNAQARRGSFEQLLWIVNDSIQGISRGIGFIAAGTPEFLQDPRRGVYSHEALSSRLAENTFAVGGLVDHSGPVIRLQSLTPEDLFVLLEKVRDVYDSGREGTVGVTGEVIEAFMGHCMNRIGEAYFRTPRTTIMAFVDLLAVLEQNPDVSWQTILTGVDVHADSGGNPIPVEESDEVGQQDTVDDDLARFKL
jgi:hypothetical protein